MTRFTQDFSRMLGLPRLRVSVAQPMEYGLNLANHRQGASHEAEALNSGCSVAAGIPDSGVKNERGLQKAALGKAGVPDNQ